MEINKKDGNLFYNEKEYNYQVDLLEEYITTFLNSHIDIIKVDTVATKVDDDIYGEAYDKDITYKKPIQVLAKYELVKQEGKNEEKGFAYRETIILNFSVLERTLKNLNLDVNIGDYIRINDGSFSNSIKIFEVVKKTDINTETKKTKNFKPFFKSYTAILSTSDVTKSLLYL
jgi:hypothetical protein